MHNKGIICNYNILLEVVQIATIKAPIEACLRYQPCMYLLATSLQLAVLYMYTGLTTQWTLAYYVLIDNITTCTQCAHALTFAQFTYMYTYMYMHVHVAVL